VKGGAIHDGSGNERKSDGPAGGIPGPRWSPDGSKIVFASRAISGDGGASEGIWVVNADGSGLRKISNTRLSVEWSPSGAFLGFVQNGDFYKAAFPVTGMLNPVRVTFTGDIGGAISWR